MYKDGAGGATVCLGRLRSDLFGTKAAIGDLVPDVERLKELLKLLGGDLDCEASRHENR